MSTALGPPLMDLFWYQLLLCGNTGPQSGPKLIPIIHSIGHGWNATVSANHAINFLSM